MKFKVSAELSYTCSEPAVILLNVHATRDRQEIVEENFIVTGSQQFTELPSYPDNNRLVRIITSGAGHIHCRYTATVSTTYDMVDCSNPLKQGAWDLPAEALRYLNPSRFCQSDKLYRLANRMFSVSGNDFEKVMAINEWIYNNVEYLSGSTNSETSAYDTVTQQAGVCRDFAHLGIALCRAMTIPARYCAVYAYRLQPQDFHACYEAYINGRWIMFDATRLAPLNGFVKIAVGRDAADTAIANLFEDVNGNYITVHTSLAEGEFSPFFYEHGTLSGLSYER